MFTTFWTLLNTLILISLIIGVPWFMISVVRLLKKIVSRLERLEKTLSEKSKDNLWGDDCKVEIKICFWDASFSDSINNYIDN